jgi:hypothetical protein
VNGLRLFDRLTAQPERSFVKASSHIENCW